jgi:phosphonate transport system substrate-binding protein
MNNFIFKRRFNKNSIPLLLSIILIFSSAVLTHDKPLGFYQQDNRKGIPDSTFNIGFTPSVFRMVNVTDAKASSTILAQEILKQQRKQNVKGNTVIIENIVNRSEDIEKNNLDMLITTSIEFLAVRNKTKLYPFAVPMLSDSLFNRIILVVRNDSNIKSVLDLHYKKLKVELITSEDEFPIIKLWAKLILSKNKIDLDKIINSEGPRAASASTVVSSVFFRKTDAAVVVEDEYKTLVELNPQIGKQLKIIAASEPLLFAVACYTGKLKNNPDNLEITKSTIFNMHNTREGKEFFKIFKMKKLIPFKEEYLNSAKNFFDEYTAIIQKQKTKPIKN